MPQEPQTKINLACGGVFVRDDGWVNLDYAACDSAVIYADLLGRLPVSDDHAALVYSSHFLEHIPRDQVEDVLAECFRVLSPDGVLRLVLPDLENMCRTYLAHRDAGEHNKANFLVLEMIDQCVRRKSGGELGRYYQQVKSDLPASEEMVAFILERTGENLHETPPRRSITLSGGGLQVLVGKALGRLQRLWIRGILQLLPAAFRAQNISEAAVGERHHWLWDFEQLRQILENVGFVDVQRFQASTSRFADFPFQMLDLDADGRSRKGTQSMYIEARKPG